MAHPKRDLAFGRRSFLRGVGGFSLALPFLPSLAETPALAAQQTGRPRLFWLGSDHGGAFDTNMFPADSLLTQQQVVVPGHTVAAGPLSATVSGGTASLSPILKASAATLTTKLLGKMNVLRGLDVPFYIAHNTGMHLGNYARNDNNGDDGAAVTSMGMRPTLDQIMAGSSSFYTPADLSGTKLRSMVVNPGRQLSWAFVNAAQGTNSPVQSVQGAASSLQLFNSIFSGGAAKSTRPPVVDKVLENYNSLRQSNTRLSAADKTRLDSHVAMIAQLQSSLNARLACTTTPPTPGDDAQNHRGLTPADAAIEGRLWADVIAAAFACDASRIGVFGWGDTQGFSSYAGNDWHQDVAHQWSAAQPQAWLTQSYQGLFEQVFLYLAAKLDSIDDGGGVSVLDNTLMAWTQECCMETHASYSIPVVTFGGAAGYFKTGMYCDYRKVGESGAVVKNDVSTTYLGLLYSQWLANVLQSMGVPPSEFELWPDSSGAMQKGFGTPYLTKDSWTPPFNQHYGSLTSAYFKNASSPLPFVVA